MAKTQFNIRLDEETKEEWERHVKENPEVETLAHLIRLAVNQRISGDGGWGGGSSADQSGGATTDDVEEIKDRLLDLDTKLESISEDVANVDEKTTELIHEDRDVSRGLTAVYELLPKEEPETEEWETYHRRVGSSIVESGRPEDLADYLSERGEEDVTVDDVRSRLDHLEATDVPLQTTVIDGERRYWRDEEWRGEFESQYR